ncbi:non-ribosomal peptide synthetase [Actinacidiphila epipremni]|uniref:Phenyloxazoline synthase MbtB n=1 Tax=Actinacidiphila epipremni TaxID=2053013 RepID=A0ABX0ZML0_9ACTN|nr:non-ribosomal peptide synthetase [Actinacidiphila epipremni]NJP43479.1 amino acid adenylation domain-containing protein [Actinacidiphila epipremni]
MTVRELIDELHHVGVRLWEEDGLLRYRAPRQAMTEARLQRLRQHKEAVLDELRRTGGAVLVAAPEDRFEPFPLTDVQSSYLLGRSTAYEYGGTGCRAYLEARFPRFEPSLVREAWRRLVERHDALRTVVHPDGHQQVVRGLPEAEVEITDLRDADAAALREAREQVRAELSAREFHPERWPLHDLRVTAGPDDVRIHLAIDLLICDYGSVQLLLGELEQLCLRPAEPLAPLGIRYRDHLLAQRAHTQARAERDRGYWWRRLEESPAEDAVPLAPAPALPLRSRPAGTDGGAPGFVRLQGALPAGAWERLRQRAAGHQVTPTVALLTAYAEVMARWSGRRLFTLDLPMFHRLPLHPESALLVGDFTSVELLTVDWTSGGPFAARAAAVQSQLWEDLDHAACSGVEVLREVARRRGQQAAVMPVVFTSTVGLGDGVPDGLPRLREGEIVRGSSRTPQVWIDCQAMEHRGGLLLGWDVRLGVFPDGLAEDAFAAFEAAVRRLADSDAAWRADALVALPDGQRERRERANRTASPIPQRTLHEGVLAQAIATPDRTAVVAGGTELTYRQLVERAHAVARALTRHGDVAGQLVGVVMDKGWEQVAAVLGTLLAGAAYVPVDTDQPAARRDAMLAEAGVCAVLTQPWLALAPPGVRVVTVDAAMAPGPAVPPARTAPDDRAYVIHTSGSTGRPKGVMVSHRAAWNTVADVNERFAVGPDDRILGLAGLGFDLSVYDIFGPLARGGCLVLPEPGRRADPSHWAALVARHGVTLWNSVPAQLQMLDTFLAADGAPAPRSLRLALLSGDWIPLPLARSAAERLPSCRLVGLGGATEAAIWSIAHPIDARRLTGPSVPYGTPLANQGWYVLDAGLQDCPDLVPGELYITGAGLALGYLGDPVRTAERFPTHPRTGERMYRTGDLGRYLPDGTVELLGRTDDQVKIRGHRVEPAELAAAAESHPAVASAVALVTGEAPADRRLAAFAATAPGEQSLTAAGRAALAAAREAGDRARSAVDPALLGDFLELADDVALAAMARTLRAAGLFTGPDAAHTAQDAVAALGAHPKHTRTLRRWLRALAGAGRLRHDSATGRYRGRLGGGPVDPEKAWPQLEELARRLDYGSDLLRLVRTSSEHLPQLLRGEEDPLALLFPHGSLDVARAAYRDNLVSRSLNAVAVAALRELAAGNRGPEPLRVLEVGAGVGGTSTDLVPALAGHDVDYLFTDVSQFFLAEARERFAPHPWVRYGLFDINEDPVAQGLAANSFDVVLCANVLHNSDDAARTLARLREVLVPGGWLVFMEATVERHPLLVSMEFVDGLSGGFADVRQAADRTFLTTGQWTGLLAEAGAETGLCFPPAGDVLAQAGQQIFLTRMKTGRARVTADELSRHLAQRLPDHLLPERLEVLDDLPLTANGKVDRARLRLRLTASRRAATDPAGDRQPGRPPADALERRLAELWAQVLQRPLVGRDDDFFRLGGDSLLVARLVGRLRETEPTARGIAWEHLLRQVLQQPTVAALAGYLRGAAAGPLIPEPRADDGRIAPVLLADGPTDAPVTVLVHDGSGTLLPYRALLEEFRRRPAAGRLLGLEAASPERYLGSDPARLVTRLGGEYAQALLADGTRRFRVIGYCMGGLIATEAARALAEAGADVQDLTVISCYRPPFEVHDDLVAEYTFVLSLGLDPAAVGFPADAGALGDAIAAALDGTPARLESGALTALGGTAHAQVVRSLRELEGRSPEARLEALALAAERLGGPLDRGRLARRYQVFRHSLFAVTRYQPEPYAGDITFLRHTGRYGFLPGLQQDMTAYWQQVCLGELRVRDIAGDHFRCIDADRAAAVRALLDGGAR